MKAIVIHQAGDAQQLQISVNAEKITQLFAYIDEHHVPVAPEKVFTLEEIVAAHQYVESSAGYGKVVVRIS
ncbi:zinc-binding dehydrogenase [Capnocytophaga leadbetteri]|uniref:zinc-binding dehydrogenase n=1 Tax=Capnocytophaga leadbetteri TaxID=327575 RepID=UPI0028F1060B|nr:zinc-binding dehydrogenase [Capnocytophaga leadbetteri]